ncbi:MAG: ribosome recycling factor [bacterium]
MYKEKIKRLKISFNKTIEYLKGELSGLQAGRATPSLIENLEVDCYNQRLPLKQLASIQTPEPQSIIIRPWDKEIIKDIERAINQSRLGLSLIAEDEFIRIKIPPLSEERRKELVKIVQEKVEESRISIRRHREQVWKEVQSMEQAKEISEDNKFRARDELQKIVDEYNKKIEEMEKKKTEEMMTV